MNPVAYSPAPDPNYQARQDDEHLRLLSLFYYIKAGLSALTGLIFIFYIVMGVLMATGSLGASSTVTPSPSTFPGAPTLPTTPPPAPPPPAIGWLFVTIGLVALVLAETLAFFTFLAGRSLARREKKTLIQVVAALICLSVPIGTLLGVFTFIVLSRPSVAALFEEPRSA